MASFGRRPTFDNGAPLLEIFLFDFKGDLYGQALDCAFIGFIREELKFDGLDALIRQMDDDSARARAMLAAAPDAFPRLGVSIEAETGPPNLLRFPGPCYGEPMFARRIIGISGPASA